MLLAISIAACGDEPSADLDERAGTYEAKVTKAQFPAKQRLGQTSLMRIAVRNSGEKTIPGLTVTVSIAGKDGRASSLPFAIHDPQPGLAQPDRPVWVLAARYPKRGEETAAGGAETSSPKTFDFGPLKAGKTIEGVWKLSAVKGGDFRLLYEIGGGLGGAAEVETAAGKRVGGSFAVRLVTPPPNTIVTDSGAVVEIPAGKQPQQGK